MHSQITQKQKNSLFLLRGKSPWLSPSSLAVPLKAVLPVLAAMPRLCVGAHHSLPHLMTFLRGSSAAMLHAGVTFTLPSPPWRLLQTASGAASGKAKWRRTSLEKLPPTSRHKSQAQQLPPHPAPMPLPSLVPMHLRKEAGGGVAGSTVWEPASGRSLGSAYGQQPSTVLCAGSSGAHSQQ